MAQIPDLRATNIASASLTNDVQNLRAAVSKATKGNDTVEVEESKVWQFAGHMGRKVIVDRRPPSKMPTDNTRYTASSWKIGARATEVHPVTGQHSYDTGNLYRTVHWKDQGFGLDGRFTDALAISGMWRHDGLNNNVNRNKAIGDPSAWGTYKETVSTM